MLKFALQYNSIADFVKEFPGKIASSGVYIKTDKPVEVGDAVGLLFKFRLEPDAVFNGTGEVVWIDTEEEAKSGKKGLVIRNIALDAASQRTFNGHLKSSVKVADPHEDHAVHTVVMQAPPPVVHAPVPPVAHAPQPVHHAAPGHAAHPPAPKKKWPLIAGIVVAVLGLGFVTWYFALGGKEIIANLGIEYRDGKVTKVDQVNSTFSMGLLSQVSSDWLVVVTPTTQWIGVRGLGELRENDRVGIRYREDEGKYEAVQITVKERVMSGTIGGLLDKTKGIFNLQDSKIAGTVVELSSEFNDQLRNAAGKLKPGDVVETVYAVGSDGKNMVQRLVVRERMSSGKVTAVDAQLQALAIALEDGSELKLTAQGEVQFNGVAGWAELLVQDEIKVAYDPETMLLKKLDMVTKYVPPAPTPKPVPVVPRVMKDVIYNADAVMARFKFIFNRKPDYTPPQSFPGAFHRVMLRVPGSSSDYPKSELFLSTGPLRTVRFTNEGSDLMITFLADKGVTPRCSFEREGSDIIALCFKN